MNTTTPVVVMSTIKAWKEDSNFAIVGGVLAFTFVLTVCAYFINRYLANRALERNQQERHVDVWTSQRLSETNVTSNASIPPNSVYSYDQ